MLNLDNFWRKKPVKMQALNHLKQESLQRLLWTTGPGRRTTPWCRTLKLPMLPKRPTASKRSNFSAWKCPAAWECWWWWWPVPRSSRPRPEKMRIVRSVMVIRLLTHFSGPFPPFSKIIHVFRINSRMTTVVEFHRVLDKLQHFFKHLVKNWGGDAKTEGELLKPIQISTFLGLNFCEHR